MPLTKMILERTDKLTVSPEITPGDHGFDMFNDAGTEVEVSEFLYSFVRMIKPKLILETGTHVGVSSSYMGLALKRNGKGKVITFEIIPQHHSNAKLLWSDLGVVDHIEGRLQDARQFDHSGLSFDMLFLDSEPQLRFDEFVKFFDALKPGGYIIIHDLNESLGHHGQIYHDQYDWPYGDFREKLGDYIKNYEIQTIAFGTPRGLTLFQKASPGNNAVNHLKDTVVD